MLQLKEYEKALLEKMTGKIQNYRNRLENRKLRLEHANPITQLQQKRQYLLGLEEKLENSMNNKLKQEKYRLAIFSERLEGLSPLRKLQQGYAYLTDAKQNAIKSIKNVKEKETIIVSVIDGDIIANVENTIDRTRK